MSKLAQGAVSSLLTDKDLHMINLGRQFERQDIVNALKESAEKQMRRNAEYSLNVGFVLELLKELKTGE
jgi:hypothetical protein